MHRMMTARNSNNINISFTGLMPIPKKAYKLGGVALKKALPDVVELSKDVDVEIIARKGFFSKIKSLIFFVSEKGQKTGEWSSLSVDPKGFMPNEHRYKTVKDFNKDDIVESVKKAKERLNKRNPQLPKPILPADAVLLAKFMEKFKKSCSI